jgi:protein-tyrosine phosphatase
MIAELYWLPVVGPGRLGVMPRPRGGDWLDDEIRSLASAGVDLLISLLTDEEIHALNLQGEEDLCRTHRITYVSFPIVDRSVPASKAATLHLVQNIAAAMAERRSVALHCRAGIGRSAMIAAGVIALAGVPTREAFHIIAEARGTPVPDTPEQEEWVEAFVDYCRLHDNRSLADIGGK